MDKPKRIKIYLLIAATFFLINASNLDFKDLSWNRNSKNYVRMIVAISVYILIFLGSKKLTNKNS